MKKLEFNKIYGNWATLLLASSNDGTIDFNKLADEIDVLIASNPNGIYMNGTAGEFYAQTENEFDAISNLLAEKCEKADTPYQIGVSHTSPQISLERLKRIVALQPGAVQVILPDWFPVTLFEAIVFLQKMEETANGIPLVLYNPPHAKKILRPEEWSALKKEIPSLVGLKVFDQNANEEWYQKVNQNKDGLSVFIPGHRLATGIKLGAHGAYSNMSCLNPFAAQRWYNLILTNLEAALELELRINHFMDKLISPFITKEHYSNHACDRFLALVGNWANVGPSLRWPYRSIPVELVEKTRKEAKAIIPEFFINF